MPVTGFSTVPVPCCPPVPWLAACPGSGIPVHGNGIPSCGMGFPYMPTAPGQDPQPCPQPKSVLMRSCFPCSNPWDAQSRIQFVGFQQLMIFLRRKTCTNGCFPMILFYLPDGTVAVTPFGFSSCRDSSVPYRVS